MSTTATKRSLQQAQADAFAFRALFPGNAWLRWETAGSVRRNCAFVGDIEHVVIPAIGPNPNPAASLFAVEPEEVNLLLHAMDRAVRDGRISHHLYPNCTTRWGARYRGADFRGFCHEVFLAEPRNYGSALAIRTGPADYSRYLVTRLRRNGYINIGGYVRNQHSWLCACGWSGHKPRWDPVPPESRAWRQDFETAKGPGAFCPNCRQCDSVEPVIMHVEREEDYFLLCGLDPIPPENRSL